MSAPDPNRSAGPAEAAIIRSHVQREEADLAQLRAQQQVTRSAVHDAELALAAAQQALVTACAIAADVDKRANDLEASARAHRGLLHPIRRLTDEILAAIFSECTSRNDGYTLGDIQCRETSMAATFRIAAVCRRWRSVAVRTEALWTCIAIDFERAERRPLAWRALITLCSMRSGSNPFDISAAMPEEHARGAIDICNALLRWQYRWRTLHIAYFASDDAQDTCAQRLLTGRLECPFLRTVVITGRSQEPTPEPVCFGLSGPLLRSLHISQCRVSISPHLQRSSIEHVTVNHFSVNPRMSDLAVFAEWLPRLRTLSVTGLAKYILDGPAPITFPSLRNLTLVGAVRDRTDQYFHCPQLIEATTSTHVGSPYNLISLLMSDVGCVPGLQKLTVADSYFLLDESLVLELLSQLPQLEELDMGSQCVNPSFFEAFSRPSSDGLWIAPRLRRLTIHVALSKDLMKHALTLVRRRSKASKSEASSSPCRLSDVTLGNHEDRVSGRAQQFQDAGRAALA